ncbi:PREDICTED: probable ATP-dependent RNA helicase spindle-E [Nicrophorus vespilloides]|uniref:Probable ATP-dependent RNA helicase spindle-E n=1 Tax=Nicrophorus vespilloides TaxID=110193 RepID=A0ABM1MD39_NICVS|nr:PREDICTED: probable ATP-dependent RNA helicase spindle-E [Nicrophorus vespilloides]
MAVPKMDYKKLFERMKKPIRVPTGVVRGRVQLVESSSDDDGDEEVEEPKLGTSYAKAYQQNEALMYANSASRVKTESLSCIDSMLDLIPEQDLEELQMLKDNIVNKVYKDYCFSINVRREKMAIEQYKTDILNMLTATPVMIIHGPTGCGKTTQVPQMILDNCRENNTHCNIVVTQPRRIAAVSVAARVCHERGWKLGTVCGYQIGLEKETNADTILTYVTTGVLLNKISCKQNLIDYTHIIIDEVHERTQDMDFLLLVIRRFMYLNSPNVKIILMSATFDTSKFAQYFQTHTLDAVLPAPTLFITKSNVHQTSMFYADQLSQLKPLAEYTFDEPCVKPILYELLVELVVIFDKLDKKNADTGNIDIGHVLVFLPGIIEIEEAYMHLRRAEQNAENKPKTEWLILPLHSSITNCEQSRVFTQTNNNTRKIILTTNIAESSITVPDVVYVIDFCLTKSMVVDPRTHYQSLKLEWASHVNCIQRSGRVGRVRDGRVYRLVPRKFFEQYMSTDIYPEMLRAPLDKVVLCAKTLNINETPKSILGLAIDPPDLQNIQCTVLNLKETGALLMKCRGEFVKDDGDLTFLGTIMRNLPIDIKLSKMICLGLIYCCYEDCIIIAAGCTVPTIFATPFQERLKSYSNHLLWADGSCSDLIALLNLYKVWKRKRRMGAFLHKSSEVQWCRQHFVSLKALREWKLMIDEITKRLDNMGLRPPAGPTAVIHSQVDLMLMLKLVISGAFYPNYFTRSSEMGQIDEREAVKSLDGLNPMNTVYFNNMEADQPGPLYTERIRELLKDCSRNIKIIFTASSKIFVSFLNQQYPRSVTVDGQQFFITMPGFISVDVYKAVRLRQLKLMHSIQVMNTTEAWLKAKELGIADTTDYGINYIKNFEKKTTSILPNLYTTSMDIKVIYVIDAAHFYAHPASSEIDENISKLDDLLNSQNLSELSNNAIVGGIYAAVFEEDKRYYRCKILDIKPYQKNDYFAKILFIDFGNTSNINIKELRQLPDKYTNDLPAQALECVLSEIQPSLVLCPRGLWSSLALNTFKEMIADDILQAKIYSVVDEVVSVKLYKDGQCINDLLIQKGYGLHAEESFLSRLNKEDRAYAQLQGNRIRFEESTTNDLNEHRFFSVPFKVEPPTASQCSRTIHLKGPYSPLEMKIHCVADEVKTVNVDGQSVNAVLLDSSPQDPKERLLVAGCVSQNSSNSNLTLRHTTLMPNIPGLPAILALLFCPRMVMKPTKDGTSFASILCGLGESEGKSLFATHDLSITLDTVIDEFDLTLINELRFWMNTSMKAMESIFHKNPVDILLEDCQREVKERINLLLGRVRKGQERKYIKHTKSWTKFLFKGDLLSPGNVLMKNDIWQLHTIMTLITSKQDLSKMRRHVEDLRYAAQNDQPVSEITCDICKVTVYSKPELILHLVDDLHRNKETAIFKEVALECKP